MILKDNTIKIAILDMYEGVENQGMRCIREILETFALTNNLTVYITVFDVRLKNEIPSLDFDLYISSGGPGNPLMSKGSEWEINYFNWITKLIAHNQVNEIKKEVFFICHSFQMACRYFNVGEVTKRKSTALGVFPVHYLSDAYNEIIFENLHDPFYAVDSRDYQVIKPNLNLIKSLGAKILAIEKARPHVPYERALMCVRFNENMIGTQFHPEADSPGMLQYLNTAEKKRTVIENHGEAKWISMIEQLKDPDKIIHTYNHILPNFLKNALQEMYQKHEMVIK